MLARILVSIGAFLVFVLCVALVAPYFIDWSSFRREFEVQASRVVGKKVEVLGDVGVRVLPFPAITMHDVSVGRDAGGEPLATADSFSMDAELAPFLSGELRIFKMQLDHPVFNLSLGDDGALSWTDTGESSIAARRVIFEDVEVRDGEIHLSDAASGRMRSLTDIDAMLSANAIEGPWRMEGTGVLDGRAGDFSILTGRPDPETRSVRVRLSATPAEWPLSATMEGDVSLASGAPVYSGDFRLAVTGDGEQDVPLPRVAGKFELTNNSIAVPEYRLEVGTRVDPYVITGEGNFDTRPGGTFLLTADGQQFNVERLSDYDTNLKKGRVAPPSARERLEVLIGFIKDVPIPQLPGKVTFRLPALVSGDTTIRSIVLDASPDGDGWRIENGSAVLPGRTQVEASGRLSVGETTDFSGSLLVASRQPSGLSQWLTGKVSPEIRDLGRAGFSADVILTPETQAFENLQIIAGDAVLDGTLSRQAVGAATPTLDFDLSGNVIDLNALRALAGLMVGDDIDTGLSQHRIHATLRAGAVNAFDLTAKVVDTDFTYQTGALTIDSLKIENLAGAAITLSGQAQTMRDLPTGSARLTLSAEDIADFVAMLRQRAGDHPLLTMLDDGAIWYGDTSLEADMTFGQDGTAIAAVVQGSANGSRIAGSWRMDELIGQGGFSGQLQLSNPDAAVLFGQAGMMPLPIPAPAGAQLSLSVDRADAEGPATIGFRAASGDTRFSATGEASLAAGDFLTGRYALSLESPDLEPYLAMNAFAVPGTAFGVPVSLKAALDIDAKTYALSAIEGTLDNNGVAGRLALARGGPVASFDGALSFDRLDMAWLTEAVFGPDFTDAAGNLSDIPFGHAYFGTAEARVDLQAGAFDIGLAEPVTGMGGKLDFRGGGMSLNGLSGRLMGGTLSGDLRLGNTDGNGYFQAQLNLANATLPDTLWQADGTPVVTGAFDLGLVVETTADTARGLKSQASGSGIATLRSPTFNGLDLGFRDDLLSWADAQGTEITNDAIEAEVRALLFGGGSFQAGDIAIPFAITDGTLQARNVLVDLPEASVYAAMQTDLDTRDLDATLDVALKLGEESEEGASAGFTIGFNGALADPTRTLDLTDLDNYLALRAVERERERVERLQADILEKQRLRREAALYRGRDEARLRERQRQEEAERLRLEEEARRAAEAAEGPATSPPDQPSGQAGQGSSDQPVDASPISAEPTETVPQAPAKSDWDKLIESVIGGAEEIRENRAPGP
ncbi:AsmA family protein [Martelella soudanensis]|uniref:AsmA family protein n=1 Tax=unclassified Martelella TaxID=2629616 RepID=UPI0015DF674C|nr:MULTISPECIES: AsmA-like C-terminal region-containing protein [unclassified Martelella]